jgi:Uma2 family endonuclease
MATDQTILQLGRSDHGRELSADEFAEASYDEPWKYERVDGKLVVMFPDSEAHDDRTEPLRDLLGVYKVTHPEVVEKVVSEAWVLISGLTDRIGDIGVFLRPADGIEPPPRPGRVPELMFEIVSKSRKDRRRDYVEKRAEYHAIGVREYVIIDQFEKKVTVLTYEPNGYTEEVLNALDVYETPLLPGLRVPISEVF